MDASETVSRRRLLQATALGSMAAGVGVLARPSGAAAATLSGVHIHASLKQTAGPGGFFGRVINITVYGTDSDLSGDGWDANPESPGAPQPGYPDVTQCYYTQRGSVQGDAVRLTGRNLFALNPEDVGHLVTVEANLATGQVKWTDGEGSNAFVFDGTGVVSRI